MVLTLREVGNVLNVSRRAIQGYEKEGLLMASGRNDRGHLLYDEQAQKRIETIKMYQDLGFSLKEISRIIDAPSTVLKAALEKRIAEIKEEMNYTTMLIEKAYEIINTL